MAVKVIPTHKDLKPMHVPEVMKKEVRDITIEIFEKKEHPRGLVVER